QAVITWHPQKSFVIHFAAIAGLKYLDHPHRVTTWRHNSHAKAEPIVVIDRAMRNKAPPKTMKMSTASHSLNIT
ncbi:MAG TPA: hypothetical protein PLZ20_17275, partial [Nitrospira sp.]|nr:hypothetical protein [Nitrospira sp.]